MWPAEERGRGRGRGRERENERERIGREGERERGREGEGEREREREAERAERRGEERREEMCRVSNMSFASLVEPVPHESWSEEESSEGGAVGLLVVAPPPDRPPHHPRQGICNAVSCRKVRPTCGHRLRSAPAPNLFQVHFTGKSASGCFLSCRPTSLPRSSQTLRH